MNILKRIIDIIQKEQLGKLIFHKSLKKATAIGIGGYAEYWFEPYNQTSLIKVVKELNKNNLKYFIIGNGSNILFSDESFKTLFISLKNLNDIIFNKDSVTIQAGSNAVRSGLTLAKKGYRNFIYMALIPGTIGGLIYMNASSYNMGVIDSLLEVHYLTSFGEVKKLLITDRVKTLFTYRKSFFTNTNNIILAGVFRLEKMDSIKVLEQIAYYKNQKSLNQPLNYRSIGSTFRNFNEIKAWELIDSVGLRGFRIGDAAVSRKHTNFLINYNSASFEEMISLIKLVKTKVKEETGYELMLEPLIITTKIID